MTFIFSVYSKFISFHLLILFHCTYKNIITSRDLEIRVECRKKDSKRTESLITVLLTNYQYINSSNESSMQLKTIKRLKAIKTLRRDNKNSKKMEITNIQPKKRRTFWKTCAIWGDYT